MLNEHFPPLSPDIDREINQTGSQGSILHAGKYTLPESLIFGRRVSLFAGDYAVSSGASDTGDALIVTGGSSAKKSGLTHRISRSLSAKGIKSHIFSGVSENPTEKDVEAAVDIINEKKCGFVIGVGGGSAIDCAKAAAFSVKNPGDIFDYIFGKKSGESALPIMAIPTTCGTGTEANNFAVITNTETGDKKSLRTPAIFPAVSLIDPELTETLPPRVLAAVGFDALCHLIESFIAKNTTPEIRRAALYGIGLSQKSLREVYSSRGTDSDFDNLTAASTLGGYCIGKAGVTAAHALEHPLSGFGNIVHGVGLAALMPSVLRKTLPNARDDFAQIAQTMGGKTAEDLIPIIENLIKNLNINTDLIEFGFSKSDAKKLAENAIEVSNSDIKQFGFTKADAKMLAENALKVSKPSIENNPKVFTEAEITEIYSEILE
jgi:alcohol dehydrogenase class IV